MKNYAIAIISFSPKQPTIVKSILACPTVSKLVFPAVLPTRPGGGIDLNSASEFDLNLVPQEFSTKSLVNIPLDGKNGIKFSSTIYQKKTVVPNVINLEFNSQHLEEGILNPDNLQALLTEIIPIFKADHASIYHQKSALDEEPRYYRTPDYKSYPLDVDWINYFGPKTIELLGRWRFNALKSCANKYDFHEGIMVILQEEPLDKDKAEHQKRIELAEAEMGFAELLESDLAVKV